MSKRLERVDWFERRLSLWMQHAERLGLCQDELAALARRIERTRDSFDRRRAAWAAAQAAAREFDQTAAEANRAGLRLLERIRAAAAADPDVWGLAGVKPGRNAAPPDAPQHVQAWPCEDGSVMLRWNGDHATPPGTSFVLERRLADRAGYRFLGITAQPQFRDMHIPAGMPFVCYRLLARRSAQISEYSEPVMVKFVQDEEGRAAA
jgi:hypothetical protein